VYVFLLVKKIKKMIAFIQEPVCKPVGLLMPNPSQPIAYETNVIPWVFVFVVPMHHSL
jgi:hypothetical protein